MSFLFSKKTSEFNPVKVTASIRMAITRLRMQQNKLVNSVRIQRRHLAELLSMQKYESARLKVEQAVRDDVSIEGLEVLALFLDLIANRVNLIAELRASGSEHVNCPPELKESVASVLWSSARIGDTVPELKNVRKYFEHKFGKEFVQMSINDSEFSVNQKIIERLGIVTPSNDRCLEYLKNVAAEYRVEGYDEMKLRDPESLVASAAAASATPSGSSAAIMPAASGLGKEKTLRTPSGLCIPRLTDPQDELEWRLVQLLRE